VLALKVGLALWMFAIAQALKRRRRVPQPTGRFAAVRRTLGSPRLLLWLGAVVVLLAAVLKALYEAALRA
jgi:putative copper export protein